VADVKSILLTVLREKALLPKWFGRSLVAALVLLVGPVGYTADIYNVEPTDSFITFSVKHLGLSSVKGRFNDFEGLVVLNKGVMTEARATIQVKTVDTGLRERDDHLRSADFFDVSNYPTITFQTKRITKNRVYGKRHNLWDGGVTVVGLLTMHGVTRELRFTAKQYGPARDGSGNMRIGLEAKTHLKRKDYGIAFQKVLETGALVMGEEVEIELSVQAINKETFDGLSKLKKANGGE